MSKLHVKKLNVSNSPVKGSAEVEGACPRVWPLVFSMMKFAT